MQVSLSEENTHAYKLQKKKKNLTQSNQMQKAPQTSEALNLYLQLLLKQLPNNRISIYF